MIEVGKSIRRHLLYGQISGAKTAAAIDAIYSKTFDRVVKRAASEINKDKTARGTERAGRTISDFCSDMLHVLGMMMFAGGKEYSVEKGLKSTATILERSEAYSANLEPLVEELNESLRIASRNDVYTREALAIYVRIWKGLLGGSAVVSKAHRNWLDKTVAGLITAAEGPLSNQSLAEMIQRTYDIMEIALFNGSYERLIGLQEAVETGDTNLKNRADLLIRLLEVWNAVISRQEPSKSEKARAFESIDIRKLVDDSRAMIFVPVHSGEAEYKRVRDALSLLCKKIEKEYEIPFSF